MRVRRGCHARVFAADGLAHLERSSSGVSGTPVQSGSLDGVLMVNLERGQFCAANFIHSQHTNTLTDTDQSRHTHTPGQPRVRTRATTSPDRLISFTELQHANRKQPVSQSVISRSRPALTPPPANGHVSEITHRSLPRSLHSHARDVCNAYRAHRHGSESPYPGIGGIFYTRKGKFLYKISSYIISYHVAIM